METKTQSTIALCRTPDASEADLIHLARRWCLPVAESTPLQLVLTPERLELREAQHQGVGPVFVDFLAGATAHRRRFGGGRGQAIARAAGLKAGAIPKVLDATGGLARDAFVLASLGCRVTVVERLVPVVALVADGMERAAADPDVGAIIAHMTLIHADAMDYMSTLPDAQHPDVVYLDPMYPPRGKTAQVKKEMRFLQLLASEHPASGHNGADSLLTAALKVAKERVVVKRPDYAPPLGGLKPTTAIKTRKHRFDVYVIRALGHRKREQKRSDT